MLRIALLAALLGSTPVLFAKERILLYRIGPSQSTLFIANADGSAERPLLPNSGFDYNASFSADGNWIIFTSERGGSADIYRVHPDGSGLERLTDDPAYDDQGALSPDGKQLAFVSSRGAGSADIWVLDLQTSRVRNLTRAPPTSGHPGHQTGSGSRSHRTATPLCGGTTDDLNNRMLSAFM
jgi:Tol biopolymer transport system component